MQLCCHWNNSMSHVLNQIQSQETCFILCNMYILKNNSFCNVRHWYQHYKYANKSYSWVIKITTPKKAICVLVGVQFETNIKILYIFFLVKASVSFFLIKRPLLKQNVCIFIMFFTFTPWPEKKIAFYNLKQSFFHSLLL